MNTCALVDVGVLVEDANHVTTGRVEHASSCDDGYVTHLVVVYTFHMYRTIW